MLFTCCGTHQTLKEPRWTRYDDEEFFDQLNHEGELGTLGALVSLTDRQTENVMDKPGPEFQTGGGQRPLPSTARVTTHIVQQLLQVLLQLAEVHAGNEAFPRFGQAVPGQLSYLVVDKAEDPIGQRENILWGVVLDELCQPLLHLRCCLKEQKTVVNGPVMSMKIIK